ncbi:hypothetical protein HGB13_00025 [bacterium]|nr:hypothetical protein [bacterium]
MIISNNPLARYKNSDPMLQWDMISKSTGLSTQTLLSVASKDENKIGGVSIATSERLRRTLGIDLGTYYKINNTDEKASGK